LEQARKTMVAAMKIYLPVWIGMVLLLSASSVAEQPQESSFVLDNSRPWIDIAFRKVGRRVPVFPTESEHGVWLALRNNCRYSIGVETMETLDEPNKNEGTLLVYDVVPVVTSIYSTPLPPGAPAAKILANAKLEKPPGYALPGDFAIGADSFSMPLSRVSILALVWWDGCGDGWGDVLAAMDTQRFEQAIALRDAGGVEEALKELAALTESTIDPEEKASLLMNECTCLTILGRLHEARERLSEAFRIAPRTHLLLYLDFEDAMLLTHERKGGKALETLDCLRREYPDLLAMAQHRGLYEEMQTLRGETLVGLNRFREARTTLEECLSFPLAVSDRRNVLYNLGVCFTNLGEKERAKKALIEALQSGLQGSDAASAHYYLGTIYSGEKAYAKALMEFEWCLAHLEEGQVPKNSICEWLANTTYSLGMMDESERYRRLANE